MAVGGFQLQDQAGQALWQQGADQGGKHLVPLLQPGQEHGCHHPRQDHQEQHQFRTMVGAAVQEHQGQPGRDQDQQSVGSSCYLPLLSNAEFPR